MGIYYPPSLSFFNNVFFITKFTKGLEFTVLLPNCAATEVAKLEPASIAEPIVDLIADKFASTFEDTFAMLESCDCAELNLSPKEDKLVLSKRGNLSFKGLLIEVATESTILFAVSGESKVEDIFDISLTPNAFANAAVPPAATKDDKNTLSTSGAGAVTKGAVGGIFFKSFLEI